MRIIKSRKCKIKYNISNKCTKINKMKKVFMIQKEFNQTIMLTININSKITLEMININRYIKNDEFIHVIFKSFF